MNADLKKGLIQKARTEIYSWATNDLTCQLGKEVMSIGLAKIKSFLEIVESDPRNVLVISGTSGANNVWLNGTQIMTNDATAWTATSPTEFYVGANYGYSFKFDGEIHAISIYDGLLDGTDAQNIYDSVDTDDWTAGNNVCITKQLGAAESGSQVSRVAYVDTNYPQAYQTILTASNRYRITGWARGDGSIQPRILDGAAAITWTGTTSTSWQYFDVAGTAGATSLNLRGQTTVIGHAEFDDVSAKEITNDGADAWTPYGGSILSKESADPQSGSLALRATSDATEFGGMTQAILTSGVEYRITGWARGDGVDKAPKIYDGAILWTGTTSTSWQAFDVTSTAGQANIRLYSSTNDAGYVEFDGVVVTRTD